MRTLFSKWLVILFLAAPALMADEWDCCPCNRLYIGGFGGVTYSSSAQLTQIGTAFFPEDELGPLAIDARGSSNRSSSGFGGVELGYEWLECPLYWGCSQFTPALEFEAFFYRHTKEGHLINPTSLLEEHDFVDTFPMNVSVFLFNGVVAMNNCWLGKFSPYVGGGIGVARLSIHGADSLQVAPVEAGVNHFNSDTSDTAWAFAAQFKTGLRYNLCRRLHIFGEYRLAYLDASRYLFGATVYPDHVQTSPWIVDVKGICYNGFAFGIQLDL